MDPLTEYEKLLRDPLITEAKKMLLETVKAHQKSLRGIVPPNPALKVRYEEALRKFSEIRGINLWYPFLGSGFGNGPFIELDDGSVKYDFIVGIGVHFFGYNHPEIISAMIDAAISSTVMQGQLEQNVDSLELMELLKKESNFDHCYITTSGALANENALKMVFQKKAPATRILAFEKCFAGRTFILTDITDKPGNREGLPTYADVDYIPFYDASRPEESTKEAVEVLKKHIYRYPKQHAAMIFELIQGEGGGCSPGTTEFFISLMQVLKDNKIAIIADEIQTFGRTSKLFAFQHFNLDDYIDLVTFGKLSQVCGVLFREAWKPKPGLIGQTFTSSTAAIKSAKVILEMMLREHFFGPNGRNMTVNKRFAQNFEKIPSVSGPYGLGAMVAFTPFDGNFERTKAFNLELFNEGVIGFIAGSNPARTRFLPPVGAITLEDVDAVCNIIEKTIRKKCTS